MVLLDEPNDPLQNNAVTHSEHQDVQCFNTLITFVNPQVCLRGPNSRQAVTLTADYGEATQHLHDLVYRRGQFSCKNSHVGRFRGLQYFVSHDQIQSVWVPSNLLHRPGFLVSEHNPHLCRAAHPCEAVYTYTSLFYDAEAVGRVHKGTQRKRRGKVGRGFMGKC